MKQFFIFIWKETKHILRDAYTSVLLLLMPISLLLVLGYAVSNEMRNIPFVVADNSKSELSRQLVERLNANEYFSLTDYLDSPADTEDAFRKGKCKIAIIIPPELENDLYKTGDASIQLMIDASDPNEAATIENYFQAFLMQFQQDKLGARAPAFSMNLEVKMLYNPQMKSAYNFVPGLIGMLLMLICAMMTSVSIVREKEMGTMEILLISPLRPTSIILAKAVPYFIISMIDVALVLIVAHFLMGVPIAGSLLTITLLSAVFTLSALSFGMLVSSVTSNQQVALLVSLVGMMLPSMLLSGLLFPIEGMPVLLQALSNIIPAKWFIGSIRDVMIKGLGIMDILPEVSVLVGITVFLLFVSVKKFKNRL